MQQSGLDLPGIVESARPYFETNHGGSIWMYRPCSWQDELAEI